MGSLKLWIQIILISGLMNGCGIFLYNFYKAHYSYQNSFSMHIGVVNLTRLEKDSTPYKDLRQFLDREHTKIRKRVMGLENEIRQQYEELKRLEAMSSQKAVTLKKQIDQQSAKIERIVQREREHLNQVFLQKKISLQNRLDACFQELVKKYNLDLLLNSNIDDENPIVLRTSQSRNLTDESIQILNQQRTQKS
jgi:Skp family chaperone for outer membrane proteins